MGCLRKFGDRMLHCRPSIVKALSNCSTPARFHHGGRSLLSPARSPEYSIGRVAAVSNKFAPFSTSSSYAEPASDDVVLVDEEKSPGPLPSQFAPCLMLPPASVLATHGRGSQKMHLLRMEEGNKKENEREFYRFFSIREKRVMKMKINSMPPGQRELLPPDEAICFGSSHGWLAFIHPRNCSLYLFSPFAASSLPYLPLPPIQTLPSIISSIRRHNSKAPASSPAIVTDFNVWGRFSPISSQELSREPFFKKIAMSSPPLPFNNNNSNTENNDSCSECTVVAINGCLDFGYSLAFCRIGGTEWKSFDDVAETAETDSFEDVVYFSKDQLFYAVSSNEELVKALDLRDPASPKNTTVISHFPSSICEVEHDNDKVNLVESSGELLMVVRYSAHSFKENGKEDYSSPKKTVLFEVYKLDLENKEWISKPSLGDNRALFIGLNESISVTASDFPELAMNCIYFSSPCAEILENSHDLGVFNLEDKSITPIYNYDLKIQLPSLWIVPPHK